MTEAENFDEIIRKKFAEKEFVFNEENWEKAEQKIASSRRRKKIALWFSVFSIGLIAGIGLMLPFVGNNNGNTNIVSQVISNDEKANEEEKKNSLNDSKKLSENNISENEKGRTENFKNSSVENTISKDEEEKEKRVAPVASKEETKLAKPKANESTNVLPTKKIKGLDNKLANNNNSSKAIFEKNNLTQNENKNSINESASIEEKNTTTLATIVSEKNNSTQNSTIELKQIVDSTATLKGDGELKVVSAMQEIKSTATDSASQKVDSAVVSSQNNATAPPSAIGGLASATYISIEAGTYYQFGWNTYEKREAQGFNLIGGIGVTHNFNQKWSLYFAAQYGSIAYLSSQKKYSNVTYGFGSTSVDTTINTSYLHYAVVPLMLQYHFNDKNAISIGGSISYLLNAKNKMTIKTTSTSAVAVDTNQVATTQTTETGYFANAFNQWDASVAVAYRRRLTKRIHITGIVNFGLLDVKNNSFFTNEKYERNSGVKLILTYNLFDF